MNITKKGLFAIFFLCLAEISLQAQTTGTLSLTFTCLPHTSYTATKSVMAVWIEDANGAFVKTRTRNVGNGTRDHLPTWAVNAGGPSNNALSTLCNVVGATSGATLSSFTAHTVAWDGTNAAGQQVADGAYKMVIQETWNHGTSGTATRIIPFNKGATTDTQTPATDANFSNISITWTPTNTTSVNQGFFSESGTRVYPNPSQDGQVIVEHLAAKSIAVFNSLGMMAMEFPVAVSQGKTNLDLSALPSGIYFVQVRDGEQNPIHKLILNR